MLGNDALNASQTCIEFNSVSTVQKGCLFEFHLQILTLLLDPNYCNTKQ